MGDTNNGEKMKIYLTATITRDDSEKVDPNKLHIISDLIARAFVRIAEQCPSPHFSTTADSKNHIATITMKGKVRTL